MNLTTDVSASQKLYGYMSISLISSGEMFVL